MVKVSIVVEGHDWAEVEFDGEIATQPGAESTARVHGGEVPEGVLQKIAGDLRAGQRLGEYEHFKWQVVSDR